MANTKQAKKMVRKIQKRTQHNRWWKDQVKETIKSLDQILAETKPGTSGKIGEAYSTLQKKVDKATKKGVIHKNKARRIKNTTNKKIKAVISQKA